MYKYNITMKSTTYKFNSKKTINNKGITSFKNDFFYILQTTMNKGFTAT